jgi:hypothetical protein
MQESSYHNSRDMNKNFLLNNFSFYLNLDYQTKKTRSCLLAEVLTHKHKRFKHFEQLHEWLIPCYTSG